MRYFSALTISALLIALSWQGSASAANISVSNTNDSGLGSLRSAILAANSDPGPVVNIIFTVTGGSPIALGSPLPALNNSMGATIIIDGFTATGSARNTSDPDYNGSVSIEIDASILTSGQAALTLTSAGNKVYGLNIRKGAAGTAIQIDGNNSVIEGCIIGCTKDLLLPDANDFGITITSSGNTIGGNTAGARNVISGNASSGILITGPAAANNVIENNWIGIGYFNASYSAIENGTGIFIDSGANNNKVGGSGARNGNIIAGNTNGEGVRITGTFTNNNEVDGNLIGINSANTAFPNTHGIFIDGGAQQNKVGLQAQNIISGNSTGIVLSGGGTDQNTVAGNLIGLDAGGQAQVANGIGIWIQSGAQGNVIGGNTAGLRNYITGNTTGIEISDSATDANKVIGNHVGAGTGGETIGNLTGVLIHAGAQNNLIGTSLAGEGNLFIANFTAVQLSGTGTSSNKLENNLIGTDAAGSGLLGNTYGVYIDTGASSNLVGTFTKGNVISRNSNSGVFITDAGTDNNIVHGNLIGLDPTGTAGLGNGNDGITVTTGPAGTTIGGTTPGAGNVISNSTYAGIALKNGVTGSRIEGNFIGTDITGTAALGNMFEGVYIDGVGNIVGGSAAGAANVISGNGSGVTISGSLSTANKVIGNLIGTDATGSVALGNLGDGVSVTSQAYDNFVGDVNPGEGNVIAYNGYNGVAIGDGETDNAAPGNRILSNSIFSNGFFGIDLFSLSGSTGVSANDVGDTDTGGGNNFQNSPDLTLALLAANGDILVKGSLDTNLAASNVQFFLSDDDASGYGEGKTLLMDVPLLASGFGVSTHPVATVKIGDKVTATATTQDGTSEFSNNVAFIQNVPPVANAGANQSVAAGVMVTLDASASADAVDLLPNGAAILDGNFFWNQTAGTPVTLSNPNSATPSFTPTAGGTYTFQLKVSDGLELSAVSSVSIVVNAAPVITGVTGQTPIRAGTATNFTAAATDAEGDALTFHWDFGDSTNAMGNPVSHTFTGLADMSYTVTVTVSDGLSSSSATFNVQVLAPNSGGNGETNISDGKPPVTNPLNGISISVVGSEGGVIEFDINVDALNRAAFDVSTDFDGIGGRVGSNAGTHVVQKFTEPGIIVATSKAVDTGTTTERGKARKTVGIGRKETGKTPKITKKPANRSVQAPKLKGTFIFGRGNPGAATLPKPDKVTLSATIELPAGLDLSETQEFSIGIGNIIDTIMVDPKGKGITPSSLGRITKFSMKYPRFKKGQPKLTLEGQTAKFTMTVTDTDLSIKGFDTEGVAPGATDLDSRNSAGRNIQVVLMMGGEPYETSAPVTFKQNKAGDVGSIISGRAGGGQ